MNKKDRQKAQILKVSVDSTHEDELLNLVREWIREFRSGKGEKRLIFTPNPEMLVDAWSDRGFQDVLNSADVNIPDGIGLKVANYWLRLTGVIKSDQTISSRLTGADLSLRLIELASMEGWRVFLLGGKPGVAERAKEEMEKLVGESAEAGFRIESSAGPEFGVSGGEWDSQSRVEVKRIAKFKPDILLVAFGHRKQEQWLVQNRDALEFGVGMGVGGTLDFMAGSVSRAPRWVRRMGLEWLFRLLREPSRWRRIWKATVIFPWLVLTKR